MAIGITKRIYSKGTRPLLLSAQDHLVVKKLRQKGWPLNRIARRYKVTEQTITAALARIG